MLLLFVCCLLVRLGQVVCQDLPQCDRMYSLVERRGHVMGRIVFPDPGGDLHLTVTIAAQLKTLTKIHSSDLKLEEITTNRGRMINYYLKFPINNPLPKIIQMIFNGQNVCRTIVPKPEVTLMTSYSHSWKGRKPASGVSVSAGARDTMEPPSFLPVLPHPTQSKTTTLQPAMTNPRATSMTPPLSTKPPAVVSSVENCGLSVRPQNLMLGSRQVQKGDWPWIATVYNDATTDFKCSGALINKRFVVVAAHCVVSTNQSEKTTKDKLVVIMGKFDFSKWAERDLQPREVQRMFIHPDFDVNTRSNDIAILYLDDNVDLTMYVRPVCLWDDNSNIGDLNQEMGTVIGWNLEEDLPRLALVPIVASDKCSEFTGQVSENTFCAGNRTNSNHCIGDAEGGLFFPKVGDNGNLRWFLRGIPSSHLQDNAAMCARGEYVVYTDVAKYTSWINQVLRNTRPYQE